jgi:orotidine-5'-phosphate decarboxylase
MEQAREKLIVALDVETAERALDLFDTLRDIAGMFKIGSQLFTAAGPDVVRQIIKRGGRVFLDLKFHDIPNTVAAAGIEATRLGVSIFNIHAGGGMEMMKCTAEAVAEIATREGLAKPAVIAVTVLTSLNSDSLSQLGINKDPEFLAKSFARAASVCGLDGVVASPQEIQVIRRDIPGTGFLVITPGVRPANATPDDQRRVMTPAEAIRAGADYLVVGRPILSATEPADAAKKLIEEIEIGLRAG